MGNVTTLPIFAAGDAPEITIFDVGHGNATMIRDGSWTAVVDVPPSAVVFDTLKDAGVLRVDHLFVSHAEQDHLGGAARLIRDPDLVVGSVYANPDPSKPGQVWERFRTAVYDAYRGGLLTIGGQLTDATPDVVSGAVRIEVLHPDWKWAMAGVGSAATGADTNTLSAVVRVWLGGLPAALLAADLTSAGLDRLIELGTNLHARVLVFPHHGGNADDGAAADLKAFAQTLSSLVEPDLIVFSHGRRQHNNPKEAVVEGVRAWSGTVAVACTQLSRHCAAGDEPRPVAHLTPRLAAGRATGASCAGTLTVRLLNGALAYEPTAAHADFVTAHAPTALCRRQFL